MSLEVTGKLVKIEQTIQVSDKFKKRQFVVELAEEINGNVYVNYASMQAVQNKCDILDRFQLGQQVKVTFNIKGNSYVDKKDGQTKYITNLDAWRIESAGGQQAAPQQQQQQTNFTPGQNGGYSQQAPPQYQPPQYNNQPIDDLPF